MFILSRHNSAVMNRCTMKLVKIMETSLTWTRYKVCNDVLKLCFNLYTCCMQYTFPDFNW